MPINLRDKFSFLFNGGRGIGTDQLDGAYVKDVNEDGRFTVQRSDNTEQTVEIDNASDSRRLYLSEQLTNELDLREHTNWQNTSEVTHAALAVLAADTTLSAATIAGHGWALTFTVDGAANYRVLLRLSTGRDINSVRVNRVAAGGAVMPSLHGSFVPYVSQGGYDYYELAYGDSPAETSSQISLADDDVLTMQTSVLGVQTEYKGRVEGQITGQERRAIADATVHISDISLETAENWVLSNAGIQYAVIPRSGTEFDRIAAPSAPSGSVTWRIGYTFAVGDAGPKQMLIRVPVAQYPNIRDYRILYGTQHDNLAVLTEYHSDTAYHYLTVPINFDVGTQVSVQTRGTGVHTQWNGLLSDAQVLAALKTALASASDADKFELMNNLAAREQLYTDPDGIANRVSNTWSVITLSRALSLASDGDKVLEIEFRDLQAFAYMRIRVSDFLALTPRATTGDGVDNAIVVRIPRGQINSIDDDTGGSTIIIARPIQATPNTNQIMLASEDFRSANHSWRFIRRTITLRSF